MDIEELKKSMEAEYGYDCVNVRLLETLMNEIGSFRICPPYKENYTKKIKENFINLKEKFNKVRDILSEMKSNNNDYEKQHSLNIMSEIELNIINKLLNDKVKLDAVFIELILIKEKLYYSLRNFKILAKRGFYDDSDVFYAKTQFKEYNNFLPKVEELLIYHEDELFEEIFVTPF